ncbi:DinB family protein [Glutamicibacter protophormiae]|uniref:DinB family protein n=1 Tax=Glutamicibacter protophormiae TaxID=37930 RepID=A0ABS4XQ60_GLUPR|nr:DinB family protein [Glutamicibacter protophormiae]MBP2398520.1 hypothetical protein [Glutamicibacter protophormiae]GGL94707.1 methyltransferase type 12 [Glutamicibacter protophormiae]
MSQIIPDGKDWTVVLRETCPECGVDVRGMSVQETAARLPGVVARYEKVLERPGAATRRNAARWSDQEYVVHVAEMLAVMEGRLDLMLEQTDPGFPNWDQDAAAEQGKYNALGAGQAAQKLRTAAEAYAAKLESISPEKYSRKGIRSNGATFTVETLNQYAWHDMVHHLWDLDA